MIIWVFVCELHTYILSTILCPLHASQNRNWNHTKTYNLIKLIITFSLFLFRLCVLSVANRLFDGILRCTQPWPFNNADCVMFGLCSTVCHRDRFCAQNSVCGNGQCDIVLSGRERKCHAICFRDARRGRAGFAMDVTESSSIEHIHSDRPSNGGG